MRATPEDGLVRIESGKLDRRVQLLANIARQNEIGEMINRWTVVATLWAQRLEMRTVDIVRLSGSDDVARGRYLIRYRSDIDTSLRVMIDGNFYAITGIEEPDRRTTLILTVEGL